jgi:hypothetical protein
MYPVVAQASFAVLLPSWPIFAGSDLFARM